MMEDFASKCLPNREPLVPGEMFREIFSDVSILSRLDDVNDTFGLVDEDPDFVYVANAKGLREHLLLGVAGMWEMPYKGGQSGGVVGFAAGLGLGIARFAHHTIRGFGSVVMTAPTVRDEGVKFQQMKGCLVVTNFRMVWMSTCYSHMVEIPLTNVASVDLAEAEAAHVSGLLQLQLCTKTQMFLRFLFCDAGASQRCLSTILQLGRQLCSSKESCFAFCVSVAEQEVRGRTRTLSTEVPSRGASLGGAIRDTLVAEDSRGVPDSPTAWGPGWDGYNPAAEYQRLGLAPGRAGGEGGQAGLRWRLVYNWKRAAVSDRAAVSPAPAPATAADDDADADAVGPAHGEVEVGGTACAEEEEGGSDAWMCPSYPAVFSVPACITDAEVREQAAYRHGRPLAAVWRHPRSGAVLSRCAQPSMGVSEDECRADQRMVAALQQLQALSDPRPATRPRPSDDVSEGQAPVSPAPGGSAAARGGCGDPGRLLFLDARSRIAATGNQAMGSGVESPEQYPGTAVAFCDIPNIHAVRGSHAAMMRHLRGRDRAATCPPSSSLAPPCSPPPVTSAPTASVSTDTGAPLPLPVAPSSPSRGGAEGALTTDTAPDTGGDERGVSGVGRGREEGGVAGGDGESEAAGAQQLAEVGGQGTPHGGGADYAEGWGGCADNRWLADLEATGWMAMLRLVLQAALRCARHLERGCCVVVHCSDGWDRTPQITATAQLLLDPYYRTRRGFRVLVEKEWCSFGHRFATRCGHHDPPTSSTAPPAATATADPPSCSSTASTTYRPSGGEGRAAAERSTDAAGAGGAGRRLGAEGGELGAQDAAEPGIFRVEDAPDATPASQRAPVFLQWLDVVWQVWRQFPWAFEFGEEFLVALAAAPGCCRFGDLLFDTERERVQRRVRHRTPSVWSLLQPDPRHSCGSNSGGRTGDVSENRSCGCPLPFANPLYDPRRWQRAQPGATQSLPLLPSAHPRALALWPAHVAACAPVSETGRQLRISLAAALSPPHYATPALVPAHATAWGAGENWTMLSPQEVQHIVGEGEEGRREQQEEEEQHHSATCPAGVDQQQQEGIEALSREELIALLQDARRASAAMPSSTTTDDP